MVEVGTEFTTNEWRSSGPYKKKWTVHGYVYYLDELYYVCVDARGKQDDIHYAEVE